MLPTVAGYIFPLQATKVEARAKLTNQKHFIFHPKDRRNPKPVIYNTLRLKGQSLLSAFVVWRHEGLKLLHSGVIAENIEVRNQLLIKGGC